METKAELKKTDGNFEAKSDAGQPKQPAWRRRLNNFFLCRNLYFGWLRCFLAGF